LTRRDVEIKSDPLLFPGRNPDLIGGAVTWFYSWSIWPKY